MSHFFRPLPLLTCDVIYGCPLRARKNSLFANKIHLPQELVQSLLWEQEWWLLRWKICQTESGQRWDFRHRALWRILWTCRENAPFKARKTEICFKQCYVYASYIRTHLCACTRAPNYWDFKICVYLLIYVKIILKLVITQ